MRRHPAALLLVVPVISWAASGDVDPGFGSGGTVIVTSPMVDDVTGLGLDADGRIVVAASASGQNPSNGTGQFFLFRYGVDGSPDMTFGDGGMVSGPEGSSSPALLVTSDGSLVVAACRGTPDGCVASVHRYDPDGHLDPTFAAADSAPVMVPEVVAQQGDQFLVGGESGFPPGFNAWIARYDGDGTTDSTFGTAGTWTMFVSMHTADLGSLVVQPDGSLVTAITGATLGSPGFFSDLIGLSASGSAGAPSPFPSAFSFPLLARTADGSIVAAGMIRSGEVPSSKIGLVRFGPTFELDQNFTADSATGSPTGLVLQPDGDIVVSAGLGDAFQDPASERFGVVRWMPDGSLDQGFGQQGLAVVFPDGQGVANRIVRQPDGKLVVAGLRQSPAPSALVVARLLVDAGGSTTTTSTTTTATTNSGASSTTTVRATTTSTGGRPMPTTTLPCASARCIVGVAETGACGDQTIPRNVTAKFTAAERLIDQAATSPSTRAARLLKKAKKALSQAGARAARAANGKKPRLSATCAMALENAAVTIEAGL